MRTSEAGVVAPPGLLSEMAGLFAAMERSYGKAAAAVGLDCRDCPDNCCDSYFLHYTYCEWLFLWEGMRHVPPGQREEILARAGAALEAIRAALACGRRPQVMCPLNERGRCVLYAHRLMICRLHGVSALVVRPDGGADRFPGCCRSQGLPGAGTATALERTDHYRQLAGLERSLLTAQPQPLPRPRLSIAHMLVHGDPANLRQGSVLP